MTSSSVYYCSQRKEMAEFLPTAYSTVLEIGCAEGGFSTNLHKGSEIWGVEPDSRSATAAARKLTKVLPGTYDQVVQDIPDAYFDLVICNDVLEHMGDHDRFLRSIREKLKTGGYLVASVPNVRSSRHLYELLVLKDWRYRDVGILDRTHQRFFTRKSLLRTLSEHAFAVELFKGINGPSHVAKRAVMLMIKLLTLGYYADIEPLQFGVRARKT